MFKLEIPVLPAVTDGFLSGVNVIDGHGHQLFEAAEYELPLDGHNRDVPASGTDKVFDEIGTNETVIFQSYRGAESPLLLGEDSSSLVGEAYERAESYGVAAKVQALALNPVAVDLTPTPGTPVLNPRLALGLLEQWARDQSTSAPMITGNALAINLIEKALHSMATILDTPVVLASGYGVDGPGAVDAGAGEAWLYITGRINVWRGPHDAIEAIDYRKNRKHALAEASYAASVDSFVGAILIGSN